MGKFIKLKHFIFRKNKIFNYSFTLLVLLSVPVIYSCAQTDSAQLNSKLILVPCNDIRIMCTQTKAGNYIIRSEAEYKNTLKIESPHPDCGSYDLPEIDFNLYTLLGISSVVSGCKGPDLEHNIYMDTLGNYTFCLNIIKYGNCRMANGFDIWCLIPKIDINSNVKFNVKIKEINKLNIEKLGKEVKN